MTLIPGEAYAYPDQTGTYPQPGLFLYPYPNEPNGGLWPAPTVTGNLFLLLCVFVFGSECACVHR